MNENVTSLPAAVNRVPADIHPVQRLIRSVYDPAADAADEAAAAEKRDLALGPSHTLRDVFDMNASECVDCAACMDSLCCLVETVMNGAPLADLLPTFAAHIGECSSCHEEYHALLSILEAERGGLTRVVVSSTSPAASADAPCDCP